MPRIALCVIAVGLILQTQARAAERLPSVADGLPWVPITDVYEDIGFFERWQRDHERRAEADQLGIQTDRPSFTYSVTTVPKNWVQLETGYVYIDSNWSLPGQPSQNTLPELTLRYGLTDRVEFRASWVGATSYNDDTQIDPWSANLQVGFKVQSPSAGGWRPDTALVATMFLPTGNAWTLPMPSNVPYQTQDPLPMIDLIYSWQLTDRLSIGGSSGVVFLPVYLQSVITRFQWTPQLSWFCEAYAVNNSRGVGAGGFSPSYSPQHINYYGYFNRGYTATYLDTGMLWRPWRNLQFDWRVGGGLTKQSDNFFTGAGFSVRY